MNATPCTKHANQPEVVDKKTSKSSARQIQARGQHNNTFHDWLDDRVYLTYILTSQVLRTRLSIISRYVQKQLITISGRHWHHIDQLLKWHLETVNCTLDSNSSYSMYPGPIFEATRHCNERRVDTTSASLLLVIRKPVKNQDTILHWSTSATPIKMALND